jgi:quinohemoprotein ethanol dehydrogenase
MNGYSSRGGIVAAFLYCVVSWMLPMCGSAAASPSTTGAAIDDVRLSHAADEPQNWLAHAGAYPDWYYSSLGRINANNVKDLKPAWYFDLDTTRGQEATPIVADDVLYTTTAWSKVYAIDARTGKQRWFFDPKVPGPSGYKSCCDVINRGPAVYEGRVYISTIDGRLIALDARNGKPVWSTLTVDQSRMYAITGAPRAMRDRIIIGNTGGETGARGYVSAYDAKTGKLVWRFYTVPGDPNKGADGAASDEVLARLARPTWFGQWYEAGGGGVVWNAITLDAELNRIYIGTGNPFPWNPKFRSEGKGDNLFTDSIVALDADTGRYLWHYQEVPGDAWDFDATEDMMLVQASIDGQPRQLLMQAGKDGYFYVLDRQTGKLLSADPFVSGITWARGVDPVTGRPLVDAKGDYAEEPFDGSPGPSGAHSWRPSAYSPKTGLVYIPASENSLRYVGVQKYKYEEGVDDLGINKGGASSAAADKSAAGAVPAGPATKATTPVTREYLLAWDPLSRKAAWRAPSDGGGGVLATGGNLVFQGQHRNGTAGELVAYRADTGERLWSYATPNAILTGAISFSVGGEQYVAVMSGAGGSADLITRGSNQELAPNIGRLVAFKLGGNSTLPADPPPAPPANPPEQAGSAQAIGDGAATYGRYCSRCHGSGARSHNVVPDLRRSPALTDQALWRSIVIDGVLKDVGMIGWAKFISPADAENVRAYVGSEARQLSAEKPK